MPRYICHKDGLFFEWSTVVDAPTTVAMTEDEFSVYYRQRYGDVGMETLPERLKRAIANGTSARDATSLEDLIVGNRAGDDEVEIGLPEIMKEVIGQRPNFGLPPMAQPEPRP